MIEIIHKYIEKLLLLISRRPSPFDDNLNGNLPTEGGVYRIFEASSDWRKSIYVGKTSNLRDRIYTKLLMGDSQVHTLKRKLIATEFPDEETAKQYLRSDCQIQYLEIPGGRDRTFFEHFTISVLTPKYND